LLDVTFISDVKQTNQKKPRGSSKEERNKGLSVKETRDQIQVHYCATLEYYPKSIKERFYSEIKPNLKL